MTFVDHGIQQALIYALPLKILGVPDPIIGAVAGVMFIAGTYPDTADWIGAQLGFNKRWELYTKLHTHLAPWAVMLWGTHYWVDKPFHTKPPGIPQVEWDNNIAGVRSWWTRLWPLACFYWALEISGILVVTLT